MLPDLSPRERLLRRGASTLTDTELVSVLLRNGSRDATALSQAKSLLKRARGLKGLVHLAPSAIHQLDLRRSQTATLLSALEFSQRLAYGQLKKRKLLNRADAVVKYVAQRYPSPDQEILGALYLDVRNRLILDAELYRGTLSQTTVEPRAILKQALTISASGFILFHTHPSGNPLPSSEDISFTRRMVNAGAILGVRLLDHIIIGEGGQWISLHRRGIC